MFNWLFKRDSAEIKALKRRITNIECSIEHGDAYGTLTVEDHFVLLDEIHKLKNKIKQLREKES